MAMDVRRCGRIGGLVLLAAGLVGLPPGTAVAAGGPTLSVTQTCYQSGPDETERASLLAAHGTGFAPDQQVSVFLDRSAGGDDRTDHAGNLSTSFSGELTGEYTIEVFVLHTADVLASYTATIRPCLPARYRDCLDWRFYGFGSMRACVEFVHRHR
jgi:hypothetical protein